jgi:hypothetical protein
MSAESLLPWFPPSDGEPLGTLDHRDILLVAGTDPHATKGTVDVVRPRLRPEPGYAEPRTTSSVSRVMPLGDAPPSS